MLIGLEYVAVAYGIWMAVFAIYILHTKRQLKIAKKSALALLERNSTSIDKSGST